MPMLIRLILAAAGALAALLVPPLSALHPVMQGMVALLLVAAVILALGLSSRR
ncbi:hypothetical protein [Sabulicella glaciei]|uniref:Uncharacterized protein n=1 Tax=Sabulicella glaciei TaxID=2984948 RepID=A0ABT3P0G0_9PROT|nr:hypothetical protein [Roseococcus sp. MDT2-1-1]MCW8087899.1 hypothetical protein [Roseococcus sp. MDT2-1-1]